ncbi:type IV pilus twitching motility protein PilT [Salinibacterium sp. ZJ70]|uniref:type IV pilus twitching motility protein PilT n=1 Tax=Salinibacterium sp. ZJ70 TaxID=2708084 RepID=UPI00272A2D32|nr:PilT/PilU family type 4a pilus ATPase [Salinibacterium sp. ZJ70]
MNGQTIEPSTPSGSGFDFTSFPPPNAGMPAPHPDQLSAGGAFMTASGDVDLGAMPPPVDASATAFAPPSFAEMPVVPEMPVPPTMPAPPAMPAPPPVVPMPPAASPESVERPAAAAVTPAESADSAARGARAFADPDILHCLQDVLLQGASDLHVSAGSPPRLRVNGSLAPIPGQSVWDRERVSTALHSLLTPEQAERFETERELDFAFTLSANARFRVNYYQQRGAIGGAFRIIPTEIKSLPQLGVPPQVGEFAKLPRGLVLVTGPTGSGKSTTLAALIDLVNEQRADHIVTVEDPIEFLHNNKKSLVNQREVGHDTHSFAAALKHVLRQDPDVILIGELRDLETISVALTAAETGHLVFATLHTQSAASTIDRVIDVYPPHQQGQIRTQLAATLQGVVCQTLVKKASGNGREVATEVMFSTPAVGNLIREGKTYQIASVLQSGASQGMHSLDQALAGLVNEGRISYASALEKSQDPDTLQRLVQRVDLNTQGARGMGS